jgi:hypothetical protein
MDPKFTKMTVQYAIGPKCKQDRHWTYIVTRSYVRVATVAVEKRKILLTCLCMCVVAVATPPQRLNCPKASAVEL